MFFLEKISFLPLDLIASSIRHTSKTHNKYQSQDQKHGEELNSMNTKIKLHI